jgi:microcystin-dependent protein
VSDAYIGEIRWFPYGRGVPQNWVVCDGSLLPIAQYEPLYTLISTTYGGDGRTTFAVPDLRGQVPIHQGQGTGLSNRVMGETDGSEQVTLMMMNLAAHSHIPQASTSPASQTSAQTMVPAAVASGDTMYVSAPTTNSGLLPTAVGPAGENQPHDNCAPTLPIFAGICTTGIFPTQN